METSSTINYIDGGTTTIDMHATQPIVYYNKLNHVYEHNYLDNNRKLLHSFIHPIEYVFHVPEKPNELIVVENQQPLSVTLLDTSTCAVKSVIWSKLKVKVSKSTAVFNEEQGAFILVHKTGQTDIALESIKKKDGRLDAGEFQIFPGLMDLQGAEGFTRSKSVTSIVLHDAANVAIIHIDAKTGMMSVKTKFSVQEGIYKLRTHPVLQIFAIMNTKREIMLYDIDGVFFFKIDPKSSKFVDFAFTEGFLKTFDEEGSVGIANLTKLSLTTYSKVDPGIVAAPRLFIHKTLEHILAKDMFNMLKIVDYKFNKDIRTLMLNNEEWIASNIFNKNLYLFNRFNMNGIYKLKDGKRFVEYYMLDGFEERVMCTAQHGDSIIIASDNGRLNIYDPMEMRIKKSAKVTGAAIDAVQSISTRVNHVLCRSDGQIIIAETSPVIRNIKVIDVVDKKAPVALGFSINKGFGDYGITSYTASYCVTPRLLRIVEINITAQFVDCNSLFEFEFHEDIIDFAFDPSNRTALILHEAQLIELNKNTNNRVELASFDNKATKICADIDFGLYAVLLQDNQPHRSFVEVYKPKSPTPLTMIEYNYRVRSISFINSDIVTISEHGLIESRPKLPETIDDDFFYKKKSKTTLESQYDVSLSEVRSFRITEAKPHLAVQTQSRYTNRHSSINEIYPIDVVEHIRSKYVRRPFETVSNRENMQSASKLTAKQTESPAAVDYKENLRRLAGTYGKKTREEVLLDKTDVLADPQDIDD